MSGVSASSPQGEKAVAAEPPPDTTRGEHEQPTAPAAAGHEPPAATPGEHEQELTNSEPSPAREPARVVVPRWIQLVLLPLALLAVWALARAAGKVLVLFIVAGLIALILNPAVALLHRGRLPRGLAVLAVYLAFFLALAGIGFLLANPISDQVRTFDTCRIEQGHDQRAELGHGGRFRTGRG